jgi:hypothetical protein
MNPYSHLNIARQLEQEICPAKPAEYYWGAVAPDVRYVAGVPRMQMHIEPQKILAFREKYPHLESFIQGYLIHCLTDLVDLHALFNERILFRPIMKRIPWVFLPVLLEAHTIEKKRWRVEIASSPNEMLRELVIPDTDSLKFAEIIHNYMAASTVGEAFKTILALNGEKASQRVEKYMNAARTFDENPIIKPILYALADLERLNRQVLEEIRKQEEFRQICVKL